MVLLDNNTMLKQPVRKFGGWLFLYPCGLFFYLSGWCDLYNSFNNDLITKPDFLDTGFFVLIKVKTDHITLVLMVIFQVIS